MNWTTTNTATNWTRLGDEEPPLRVCVLIFRHANKTYKIGKLVPCGTDDEGKEWKHWSIGKTGLTDANPDDRWMGFKHYKEEIEYT